MMLKPEERSELLDIILKDPRMSELEVFKSCFEFGSKYRRIVASRDEFRNLEDQLYGDINHILGAVEFEGIDLLDVWVGHAKRKFAIPQVKEEFTVLMDLIKKRIVGRWEDPFQEEYEFINQHLAKLKFDFSKFNQINTVDCDRTEVAEVWDDKDAFRYFIDRDKKDFRLMMVLITSRKRHSPLGLAKRIYWRLQLDMRTLDRSMSPFNTTANYNDQEAYDKLEFELPFPSLINLKAESSIDLELKLAKFREELTSYIEKRNSADSTTGITIELEYTKLSSVAKREAIVELARNLMTLSKKEKIFCSIIVDGDPTSNEIQSWVEGIKRATNRNTIVFSDLKNLDIDDDIVNWFEDYTDEVDLAKEFVGEYINHFGPKPVIEELNRGVMNMVNMEKLQLNIYKHLSLIHISEPTRPY